MTSGFVGLGASVAMVIAGRPDPPGQKRAWGQGPALVVGSGAPVGSRKAYFDTAPASGFMPAKPRRKFSRMCQDARRSDRAVYSRGV